MKNLQKLTIFHFVSQAIRNHILNALKFLHFEIFTFISSSSLFHLWLTQEIPFNRNFITLLHKRIFVILFEFQKPKIFLISIHWAIFLYLLYSNFQFLSNSKTYNNYTHEIMKKKIFHHNWEKMRFSLMYFSIWNFNFTFYIYETQKLRSLFLK